jgi:hypothetical protein
VKRRRRMNRTRFRDVSLEFYEIGMSHNSAGNTAAIIQSECVFIDTSPLGEAAASKETQQTS